MKLLRILYLEDEPLARWTGRKILEPFAAHVMAAESCAEAAALWRGQALDLIVCDYRLEDGVSTDLIARMRAEGRAEPVVCLSGESETIGPDEQARLGLVAVLKKPLESDALRDALARVERAMEARAERPAVESETQQAEHVARGPETAGDDLLWLAPEWGVIGLNRGAYGLCDAIADARGAVWALAADVARETPATARQTAALRVLFRQLARWMPPDARAADLLARCRDGLARDLGDEESWEWHVVHVGRDGWSYAARRAVRWQAFCERDDAGWGVWASSAVPIARERVRVVALLDAPLLETLRQKPGQEQTADEELAGWVWREWGEPPQRTVRPTWPALPGGHLLMLWRRAPQRALAPLWPTPGDSGAVSRALRAVEEALLAEAVPPLTARRFCCGLLDLLATEAGGPVTVEWDAAEIRARWEGTPRPAADDGGFFDRMESGTSGVVGGVRHGPETAMDQEARSVRRARSVSGGASGSPNGMFELVALPEVVTEQVAREAAEAQRAKPRVALLGEATRYVSGGALRVFKTMAAERQAPSAATRQAAGCVCGVGFSPLMERLLKRQGADRDLELRADMEALAVLGRRLTTRSERASVLDSIVERT